MKVFLKFALHMVERGNLGELENSREPYVIR